MTFSEEIKKAREASGLSQQALAKVLDVPSRTYESWEMGERTPPKYVQALLLEKVQSLGSKKSSDNSK